MSQFCISCGVENPDEAKFCKSCGQKLKTTEAERAEQEERVQKAQEKKKRRKLLKKLNTRVLADGLHFLVSS